MKKEMPAAIDMSRRHFFYFGKTVRINFRIYVSYISPMLATAARLTVRRTAVRRLIR